MSITRLFDPDFNHGGSIANMMKYTTEEIIEFAVYYKGRAKDPNYHMENDNFDASIFLHRCWLINHEIIRRGIAGVCYSPITEFKEGLIEEGLESAIHEPQLVRVRILDLSKRF